MASFFSVIDALKRRLEPILETSRCRLLMIRFAGAVALSVNRLGSAVRSSVGPWRVTVGLLVSTTTLGAEQEARTKIENSFFIAQEVLRMRARTARLSIADLLKFFDLSKINQRADA